LTATEAEWPVTLQVTVVFLSFYDNDCPC
jgi:hypothetical protein